MRARRRAVVAGLLLVTAASTAAAERDFAFTWTTHVLERGRDDLEVWLTPRLGRVEDYSNLETRFAWTHGVVKDLESQVSLDLAFETTKTTHSVDPRLSSLWRWAPWKADDVVGLGVVGRASLGFDVLEVEARLVADKRLGEVLLAANALASQSFLWNGRSGATTRLEESLGVAYQVAPFCHAGLEVRVKSAFARGAYQGTALYVGPTLAFRFKPVWFALGATAQVVADQAKEDEGTAEPLALRDDERFVLRLTFGFPTD